MLSHRLAPREGYYNADEPHDKRIDFRIGVNLGDVIVEGEDIHGDGVNIAARLEGLKRFARVSRSDHNVDILDRAESSSGSC